MNQPTFHQIKVSMNEIKPEIWRRVQVPSEISLSRLHRVLQVVMGWKNAHLYEFHANGHRFADPDPEGLNDQPGRNARKTKLREIAPAAGARIVYVYDLGDYWQHLVLVEKVLPAFDRPTFPVCLGGERACPPEDCGGVVGYEELVAQVFDPTHPEHPDTEEWLGSHFDSEAFSLDEVNSTLRTLR